MKRFEMGSARARASACGRASRGASGGRSEKVRKGMKRSEKV